MQVVVLHKEMGMGLGFSVAGGVDQNKPVTVSRQPSLLLPLVVVGFIVCFISRFTGYSPQV